jgi:hypothetical protein
MNGYDIWLWLKLDTIREACGFLFFVFGIAGFVPFGGVLAGYLSRENGLRWPILFGFIVLIGWLFGLANVLIPSSKQASAIYAVPLVTNSSVATNDLPEIYDMGLKLIKQKLEEASR